MKKTLAYFLVSTGLALMLLAGCTDRGTNIPVVPDSDFIRTPQDIKVVPGVHDFYPELIFQVRNQFRLQEIATYIPDVSVPPPYGPEKSVPLLVLLPPQDGNQYYYFNHGLQELADQLIAEGTIQPMIIACLSNDKVFGGYFFAGASPFAGVYDAMIGGSLVRYLNNQFPLLDSPAKRAIGGVGQGAYGALRAAILYPNQYTSVAVADGPLDFDGRFGDGGLIDLFDDALAEQGLDASTFKQFDSSGVWDVSRLFIGGSIAFSPNITSITFDTSHVTRTIGGVPFTEIEFNPISVTTNPDTMTLIRNVVRHTGNNYDYDVGFHLPFDGSARPYMPIWNIWLDNNLENLLDSIRTTFGWTALAEAEILVMSTDQARHGYHEQTKSFARTAMNPPFSLDVTYKEYKGADGNPATHDQYLYELMREMLIFHSKSFGRSE